MKTPAGTLQSGPSELAALRNNTANWWFLDPGMRRLALAISVGLAGATSIGFDGSLMTGLMANPLFMAAIDHPSPIKLALIVCGIPFGGLLSVFPSSWVSDKYGRRIALAIGYSFVVAGSLVQTFVTGGWTLMGGRFIVGFGACAVTVPGPAYTAEVAHPRNRPQATGLLQSGFFAGAAIAAWVDFGGLYVPGDWSWRMCLLLQVVIPIYVLIMLPFLPDSPRWLVAKGRDAEAHAMLARYHANGDMDDELVLFELAEIKQAIALEQAAKSTTWMTFLETRGNRHRLAIVVWCGNGILTYYLIPILMTIGVVNPAQQAGFNGGLQIWNYLIAVMGALVINRLGRRKSWLIAAGGMFVSYVVITACSAVYAEKGDTKAGPAVLTFIFVFFGFYNAGFTPLYLAYPLEILPYSLRAKGCAILAFLALFAGAFNALVNPVALAAIAWKFYFVYLGCLLATILAIIFLFPETNGFLLEEVAVIFDGEDAVLAVQEDLRKDETTKVSVDHVEYAQRESSA